MQLQTQERQRPCAPEAVGAKLRTKATPSGLHADPKRPTPGTAGVRKAFWGRLDGEGRGITRRLARSRASWAGPVAAGVHTVSLRGTGGGGETLAHPGRLRASSVTPGPGGWIWE